ncbi:MAG: type II secretion system F family protein [Planctomycetes bacterium]|nr:type II secretion system F family protein [Planctomycetota bacterium]
MLIAAVILALILCLSLVRVLPLLACALSVLLTAGCLFAAAIAEDIVALVMAPGIFLGTCVLLFFLPVEDERAWRARRLARGVLLSLLGLGALIFIVAVLGPLTLFGAFLFLAWVVTMVAHGRTARWSTSLTVLSTVGACMRQNLPLPMALEMAATHRKDQTGFIFRKIKEWLVQGYSVVEAIQLGYPKCPAHALGVIRAAAGAGQLPQGLAGAIENIRFKARNKEAIVPVHPIYPLFVLAAACVFSISMAVFVIPDLASVIQEMTGEELPLVTRLLLACGTDFRDYFPGLAAVLLILYLCWRVLRWAYPRDGGASGFVNLAVDVLRWHTPILHWFEYHFNMIQLTETLRMSLTAGCTVDKAIANCLDLDLNRWFKRRVVQWLSRTEAGEDVAEAARQCRLAHPLAWAFDVKVNQGNTLNVLAVLERFYRSNYSYYIHLAKCTLTPTITLLLAAVVGFIVLAIFTPGVAIISGMTDINP